MSPSNILYSVDGKSEVGDGGVEYLLTCVKIKIELSYMNVS